MKNYKFQALVTMREEGGGSRVVLDSAAHRMVLRGQKEESGRSRIFRTLVSCDDGEMFRPASRQQLVTLRLAGDDVSDYLEIGGHFDLLLGDVVGHGVITRRLFT